MSHTPEENKLPEEALAAEGVNEEEQSTIFGAPPVKAQKQKRVSSSKRMIVTAVSLLLAVALLAGMAFVLSRYVPKTNTDDTSSENRIMITSLENEEVSTITLKTGVSSVVYRTELGEAEDGSGEITVSWTIDGIDPSLTASAAISLRMDTVLKLKAIREIDIEDGADYGFDNPTLAVEIKGYDPAADLTLLVGAQTPSASGYYTKRSDKETVYLTDSADIEELLAPIEELSNSSAVAAVAPDGVNDAYFEDETLATFDSLTLKRKGKTTLSFACNNNDTVASYMPYLMTAPANRYGEGSAIDTMLTMVQDGLEAQGAYKFYPTAADIKRYGLSDPEFTVIIKYGTVEVVVKGSLQEDGNYAVMTGGNDNIVYCVDASDVVFADMKDEEFASTMVFAEGLKDLSRITIKTRSAAHVFDIAYDEDAEDSKYTIKANGKQIEAGYFQTYYQYVVGTQPNEMTFEGFSGTPVYTLTADYADGSLSRELKFIKYSDRRYYIEVDGTPIGYINATHMEKLLDYLELAANGEEVPSMY